MVLCPPINCLVILYTMLRSPLVAAFSAPLAACKNNFALSRLPLAFLLPWSFLHVSGVILGSSFFFLTPKTLCSFFINSYDATPGFLLFQQCLDVSIIIFKCTKAISKLNSVHVLLFNLRCTTLIDVKYFALLLVGRYYL